MTGALGRLGYSHFPQVETFQPTIKVMFPFLSVAVEQNDYLELVGTVQATGPFDWEFQILAGNATLLGLSGGHISSPYQNTYTFKSLLVAQATSTVTIAFLPQSAVKVPVGDGLLLVKTVARGS